MVARHAHRYVVTCRKDLDEIEQVLGSSREPVVVEANADSAVLSEIEEFRNLAAAARVAGSELSFASDDPLRRELARIVGLTVEDASPAVSGVRRAIQSNAPTRPIQHVGPPAPSSHETVPALPLAEVLDEYTAHGNDDESWASFSFVVNPPVPRRPAPAQESWYRDSPESQHYPRSRPQRSPRRVGRAAGGAVVAALVLLLASSAILFALMAPQATITLVPATSLISADVTYGVAGQAGAFDIAIEPVAVTGEISVTETIATTGVRSEPDGVAVGDVVLTNPTTIEVFLPAGSTFTVDGLGFSTVHDVIVPAADPFGSGAMGSAAVPVEATAAGPDSNLTEQSLAGQLENGLFYSNREPFTGGTMRDIAVVADADLAVLQEQAEASLAAQQGGAVTSLVPEGHELVEGTAGFGDIQFSFSLEPGVDGEEVSVRASQAVRAEAFDPQAMQEMAREELNTRLFASIPADNVLLAESITTSEPVEVMTESGNPEYRMSASASTRAVIDPNILDSLKSDLVGASEEEAAGKVALLHGVAGFEIEYGPEWFPLDWPPRLESRIAIHIDDSAATEAASGTTRP